MVTITPKTNMDAVKSPKSKSLIWPYLFIQQTYSYRLTYKL